MQGRQSQLPVKFRRVFPREVEMRGSGVKPEASIPSPFFPQMCEALDESFEQK